MAMKGQEIAEKVQQLSDQIQDFEMVHEQTFFEAAGPKTLSSHIWFKKSGQYRVETSCNGKYGKSIAPL